MFKLSTGRQWKALNAAQISLHRTESGIANALNFIKAIEQGNLEAEYSDTSTTTESVHQLITALIQMREQMKYMAEQEQQRNWISEGLARFVEILRSHPSDMHQLYDTILSSLVKYLRANQGGLFVAEESRTTTKQLKGFTNAQLRLVACYAYNRKKYLDKTIAAGEGLLGQCFLEKEIVYLTDLPPHYLTITSGLGEAPPRVILLVPLKLNDEVLGVLELASFTNFESYQIEFVRKLGESIAATISNVNTGERTQQLLKMAQEQAEELKSQEEEMRQNLEELSATQEQMRRREAETQNILLALQTVNDTFATIEFDMQGNVLTANSSFLTLMGYAADEIRGLHHRRFVDAKYAQSVDYTQFWQNLREGNLYSGEVTRYTKTGRLVWMRVSYAPVRNSEGEYYKVIKLAQDVTETRRATEEAKRLSLVADNTDNSVIITNSEGLIEYVNRGFERLTGYTLSEVKGRKPGSFLQGPDTNPETVQRIRQKLAAHEPFYEEILNYSNNGDTYWISLAINPVWNEKGELEKFISVQANITETKKQSLDSRCKLEAIDKAYGVVEFDTKGNILWANDNFITVVGYSLDEITGQHHSMFVLPEERQSEQYKRFWQQLGEKGEFIRGEFKRVAKNGDIIWLKGSYSAILDLQGRPYKVIKYAQSITAEKKLEADIQRRSEELVAIEEELRQNLEELSATQEDLARQFAQSEELKREMMARENVLNLTTILSEADVYGTITYINDKLCEISKYSREELIGQPHNIFRHPDMPKALFKQLWATIKQGKVFRGVVKNQAKDGTYYWVDATISPVLDDSGKPVKYIGVRYVIPDETLAERLYQDSLYKLTGDTAV